MAKKEKRKKVKKEKPEKEPKMRSSAPRRLGAWTLVVFMISMIAFGAYKIINSPTEQGIEKAISRQMSNLDKDTIARTKAVSFAERFATDYFTYIEGEEYVEKLTPYYASGVPVAAPDKISQVGYVGAAAVEVNGSDVNVDVICKVLYASENKGYDVLQYATLRVPIRIDKNGNCAVVALPIYVGNNNNTRGVEPSMNTIDSNSAQDTTAIETTIKNFFEVYYKGAASELKYYVTKNYGEAATTGLGIDVTDVETQISSSGDKWDAECTVKIDNNGINQTQHCYLEIVQGAEGRYYINKLYTIN